MEYQKSAKLDPTTLEFFGGDVIKMTGLNEQEEGWLSVYLLGRGGGKD